MVRRVGCSHGAVARNIWDFGVVEDYAANILVAPEKPQAEAELDILPRGPSRCSRLRPRAVALKTAAIRCH